MGKLVVQRWWYETSGPRYASLITTMKAMIENLIGRRRRVTIIIVMRIGILVILELVRLGDRHFQEPRLGQLTRTATNLARPASYLESPKS